MRVALLPLPVFVLSCGMFAVGCGGSGSAVTPQSSAVGGDNSTGGVVGAGGVDSQGGASSGVDSSGVGGGTPASSTLSTGGTPSTGGTSAKQTGVGGNSSTGGTKAGTGIGGAATGGTKAAGGTVAGGAATGGAAAGGAATGGTKTGAGGAATGGFGFGTGGAVTGGTKATGGAATGGTKATGGAAPGGATSVAGAAATGGATVVSTSTSPDPDCNATMPTSGGAVHTSSSQGGTNPLAWNVWSNGGQAGTVTIFSTPAFSATWNQSNNYLGRLGLEWGNAGGTYDTHGTITAQFVEKRSAGAGSGGSWSYVGIYGWSINPCIEWYIIDDSFSTMPTNPGNCANMSNSGMTIDGAKYTMCKRSTNGTGGDRCGGAGTWNQYYSIRQSARACGTINITAHFDAWKAAGNNLGNLLEAKILVEVGGGSGTIDFPVASVTSTK